MKSTNTPTTLRRDHTVRRLLSTVFAVALFFANMISPAYAVKFQDSDIYKGSMDLLQDLSTAAIFAGPAVCGLVAVIFFIRKSMSDEQDDKMWNKRIVKAIICGVAIGLVSGAIALISAYYNPTTP